MQVDRPVLGYAQPTHQRRPWRLAMTLSLLYFLPLFIGMFGYFSENGEKLSWLQNATEVNLRICAAIVHWYCFPLMVISNGLPLLGSILASVGRSPRRAFLAYLLLQPLLIVILIVTSAVLNGRVPLKFRTPTHGVSISHELILDEALTGSFILSIPLMLMVFPRPRRWCLGKSVAAAMPKEAE